MCTGQRQVVLAQRRGDACYAGRRGWYWHQLDKDCAIDVTTVTGPYRTEAEARRRAGLPPKQDTPPALYNKESVDAAIKASRQRIGGREARAIHALLRGRG